MTTAYTLLAVFVIFAIPCVVERLLDWLTFSNVDGDLT